MSMKSQRNLYLFIGVLFFCGAILLIGCSFPGNIYISLSWEWDYDVPDLTFSCDVPNVPTDIADVAEGVYYFTRKGDYTLQYNYTDDTYLRTLTFTLEPDVTTLGNENAYYDVIIAKAKPPAIYKVPANP
jgi:hypothetical protein